MTKTRQEEEIPEGIIITISKEMLKETGTTDGKGRPHQYIRVADGYKRWLKNFLHAMDQEDWTYWMRLGAKPRHEVVSVYLCIGGKVRFRANYVGTEEECNKIFNDGKLMFAKVWLILAGPVTRPRIPLPLKGFRGFRYTQKLF